MGISDRTAETQPADAPEAALDGRLGRYAIEAPLGRGGLGVVYLAYDPELQRRVALKVLRADDADNRARLLREARAMARLRHPNVVTVYDVGTVDDRDYVTMELMDGGTLEAWLATPRSPGDIAATFVACGRGLVAAHAAGLVHRDVKPANILRAADGRVALTDFGLARDHDAAREMVADRSRKRPSGVTATGLVLGTPAYMPPEQWSGATTQASDQFAFCVSMFEAFAGARPYAGDDDTTLIAAVERGPGDIDARALRAVPRWLRRVLVRGLEPDPARRWPSMAALVDALVAARRRPRMVFAATTGSAALVAVAVASSYVGSTQAPTAVAIACRTPARAFADVWNPGAAAQLRALGPGYQPLIATLDDDAPAWAAAWAKACAAPGQVQEPRLACLDGIVARVAMIRAVAATVTDLAPHVDAFTSSLVEPSACVRDDRPAPRLRPTWSAAAQNAFAAFADRDSAATVAPRNDDVCQATFAFAHAGTRGDHADPDVLAKAAQNAGLCGDDRLIADVALLQIQTAWRFAADRGDLEARAWGAVQRVEQDDLDAFLHTSGSGVEEQQSKHVDIAACRRDLAAFERRHQRAAAATATQALFDALLKRHAPGDVAAVAAGVPGLLAASTAAGVTMADVHRIAAEARWDLGDLAGAHAEMAAGAATEHYDGPPTTGIVVDRTGRPVAGARVVAQYQAVIADRAQIGLLLDHVGSLDTTVTDRDGRFSIATLPPVVIAAETDGGARRSAAIAATTTGNRLVVEPTRRIAGRIAGVDVAGMHWPLVVAHAVDGAGLLVFAPLDGDGRFELAGMPDRAVDVAVTDGIEYPTSSIARVDRRGDVAGVELHAGFGTRVLDVTVRSASVALLQAAVVYILEPGGEPPQRYDGVLHRHRYALEPRSSNGSHVVVTHLHGLPDGAVMACANADFGDDQVNSAELAVACKPVAAGAGSATIEVTPPQGSAAR